MAIKLYKSGSSTPILTMDTIQSLDFNVKGNVMDVPIPDEQDAMIMNMGGVSRSIGLKWTLVSSNIVADIVKLVFNIIDGTMFNDFIIEFEDWNIRKECVIEKISLSYRAGESSKIDVTINIIIGSAMM